MVFFDGEVMWPRFILIVQLRKQKMLNMETGMTHVCILYIAVWCTLCGLTDFDDKSNATIFLLLIKDQGDAKRSIYNWLVKFHDYWCLFTAKEKGRYRWICGGVLVSAVLVLVMAVGLGLLTTPAQPQPGIVWFIMSLWKWSRILLLFVSATSLLLCIKGARSVLNLAMSPPFYSSVCIPSIAQNLKSSTCYECELGGKNWGWQHCVKPTSSCL